MDLTQISNHELLDRVEKLSRTERKITHLILCHLVEVETRRLHLDLGYTSLFRYMTVHLQYSEDAAYRRIQAGLLKKMPQLEKSIEAGEVNLTQLQQVQNCLNKEIEQGHKITIQQTEKVLEHIQNKSSFEAQKILAVEFNQPIQQIENSSVSLLMKTTEDKRATVDNEAIANKKAIEIKRTAVDQRPMPNKKTTTNKGTSEDREPSSLKNSHRPHIKITTRRALLKRAQHQCEYVHSTTGRCTSKFQLQVDHQRPLAWGARIFFQIFGFYANSTIYQKPVVGGSLGSDR